MATGKKTKKNTKLIDKLKAWASSLFAPRRETAATNPKASAAGKPTPTPTPTPKPNPSPVVTPRPTATPQAGKAANTTSFNLPEKPKTTDSPPVDSKLERFRQQVALAFPAAQEAAAGKEERVGDAKKTTTMRQSEKGSGAGQTKTASLSGANGIPEAHRALAEVVAKLPQSFPTDEWDDMNTAQQRRLVSRTELTKEEQWTLLNAETSVRTLATVQDLMENRSAYGLTYAAASQISGELWRIANARIGIQNGAETVFSRKYTKKVGLSLLDEREAKLLEGVGVFAKKPNPTLSDERGKTPIKPLSFEDNVDDFEETKTRDAKPVDVVYSKNGDEIHKVEGVPPSSSLGQMAKTVLKFYLGGYIINPISNRLLLMENLGKLINKGTVSIGVSGSAILIGGASGNIGLVMDTKGDVGVIYSYGGFGGIPSASVMGFVSVTNAENIAELNGDAFETGVSGIPEFPFCGETCIFTDSEGNIKKGVNLLSGPGLALPFFEVHSGIMKSTVIERFNLYDEWRSIAKGFRAW